MNHPQTIRRPRAIRLFFGKAENTFLSRLARGIRRVGVAGSNGVLERRLWSVIRPGGLALGATILTPQIHARKPHRQTHQQQPKAGLSCAFALRTATLRTRPVLCERLGFSSIIEFLNHLPGLGALVGPCVKRQRRQHRPQMSQRIARVLSLKKMFHPCLIQRHSQYRRIIHRYHPFCTHHRGFIAHASILFAYLHGRNHFPPEETIRCATFECAVFYITRKDPFAQDNSDLLTVYC